jgi:hypothetical protein
VRHDAPLRRLVVVRRHDEEAVDAELVRLLRQVDRVRRRVGSGACDDGATARSDVDCGPIERHALGVGKGRRLTGCPGDDDAVGAVVEQEAAQRAEGLDVDRAVLAKRRHDRGQNLAQHGSGL